MDKISNPFTPGAGYLPPELAGRDSVLEDGLLVAKRAQLHRAERGLMLIGPRGVGKTALLRSLAECAHKIGVITLSAEIRDDGHSVEELTSKVRDALHTLDFNSKVKTSISEAFSTLGNFIRKFSINIGGVGVEVEANSGLGGTGNVEYDLSEVLISTAKAAKASNSAIGLYLDELQNMRLETLRGIIMALHRAAQDLLPLYLIGSGLPTIMASIAKSKTYAERMFNYENIGALDERSTFAAISKPLGNVGVRADAEALHEVFMASRGYPFFIQEIGYQLWQVIEAKSVSADDIRKILPTVFGRLDQNFFDVRFDRVSQGERKFLRAMADVAGEDGRPLGEVARVMGKAPSALSMVRRSLIRKGMIYSPQIGKIQYTVPLFAEYIRRVMPNQQFVK